MTDGTCFLCGDSYTKRGMTRHLRSCLADNASSGEDSTAIIQIMGEHRPDYWLSVAVDPSTTLATLDEFLRAFWVECCGHLSAFTIDGVQYDRPHDEDAPAGFGPPPQSMDVSLDAVLEDVEDATFGYEYDFGTTTALSLSVVETGSWEDDAIRSSLVENVSPVEDVIVLAQNDQPERTCADCGDQATVVCQSCLRDPDAGAYFCESCADAHDDEEGYHAFLPVVNSPRSGVCGYRG